MSGLPDALTPFLHSFAQGLPFRSRWYYEEIEYAASRSLQARRSNIGCGTSFG